MKSKTVKLKDIRRDFPMTNDELIDLLTDLEEKGLITGVGKDKIKMSPDAEHIMKCAVLEAAEKNKDVV